ncbi:MAG: hypothetical protein AM1032_000382 [Mycoplasmataceae bacterium]|nr:MAG: hypothetical protein AM1032_000382 [Mycoplasmataceae bacterium]
MQAEIFTDEQKKLIAIFTIILLIAGLIGLYYLSYYLIIEIKKCIIQFKNKELEKDFL